LNLIGRKLITLLYHELSLHSIKSIYGRAQRSKENNRRAH
jgi:hypothetical protein